MHSQSKITPAIAVAAVLLTTAGISSGKASGVAFSGCDGCHGSTNTPPVFELKSDPETFSPGETVTLELRVTQSGMRGAGYYLTTDEGKFDLVDRENAKLISDNVAHDNPLSASDGSATVKVRWTAPDEPGGTDFQVFGLATNGDGGRNGDSAGAAMLSLVYGCSGSVFYKDLDRDGIGSSDYGTTLDCAEREGWVAVDGDCNENNADVFPGQTEVCNERDDDCNGQIDEGTSPRELFPDADGDGFGVNRDIIIGCVPPNGYTDNSEDCNDNDAEVHPEAAEVCNGFDDNCNGRRDEGVRDRCGVGLCERYTVSCFSDECYPGDPFLEQCNGLDDDCDGIVDNNTTCPVGQTCYMFECIAEEDARMLAEQEPQPASQPGTGPSPREDPLAPGQGGGTAPVSEDPNLVAGSDAGGNAGSGCGLSSQPAPRPWLPLTALLVAVWATARRKPRNSQHRAGG